MVPCVRRSNLTAQNKQTYSRFVSTLNKGDFVADRLYGGSKLRVLTLIDVYTRECLAAVSASRMGAGEVVETLEQARRHRGAPKRIYCDQGSKFAGRLTDLWAYQHKVTLRFSRPGRPTDNAYIESFNHLSPSEYAALKAA